ncbi:MAG: cysteine--tRNA ligase [bacterium]|nr:cysteine--tRNA ligase [bacterium]
MLKIYNTLTKQKEEFNKPAGDKVRMFVCGPTVYDYPHIGHARTYIVFDVIAKYLRYKGFEVEYLQNITDIDDKIIARAKEQGVSPKELAEKFEKIYTEDMESLGIDSVSKYARATEHIPEIVSQVKRLIEKGFAYKIDNDPNASAGAGGYYFDISSFPDYGKLSGRSVAQAEDSVSRIDDSVAKRNKGDFALWKFSNKDEAGWDTELGYGRPGWHIEDTAISEKYFGDQYEIHCGAQDLMFPHHESEIAQQEAASGKKPFVQLWLHSGLLTVDGKKMSKSLGNFVTIREVLKKYSPEAVRMMFLMSHYRSPVDYSEQNLKQAEAAVQRLGEFIERLKLSKGTSSGEDIIGSTKSKFSEEVDDDFNTAKAIAGIFDLVREANQIMNESGLGRESADKILTLLNEFNEILGIIPAKPQEIPEEVKNLVDQRESLRKDKKYNESDKLREQIKSLGYEVEDTVYGPLVKKL